VPPPSPGQSCCLRCAECSGLPFPVHPADPHILPGDCMPGGRSAAPMAGRTVGRQVALMRTQAHLTFCPETLPQNLDWSSQQVYLELLGAIWKEPSLNNGHYSYIAPSEKSISTPVPGPQNGEGELYNEDPSSVGIAPPHHPNSTPHPFLPTSCKGGNPYLFIQPQLWRGTTGIFTG
jgi:hypothetical protein